MKWYIFIFDLQCIAIASWILLVQSLCICSYSEQTARAHLKLFSSSWSRNFLFWIMFFRWRYYLTIPTFSEFLYTLLDSLFWYRVWLVYCLEAHPGAFILVCSCKLFLSCGYHYHISVVMVHSLPVLDRRSSGLGLSLY